MRKEICGQLPFISKYLGPQKAYESLYPELIELLEVCLEADAHQFTPHIGPLCPMLGKAAQDGNPEMKNKTAYFSG